MSKDAPGKPKAYLKKMQKALKKAPISHQEKSEDNLQQIDWNDDRRLQYAKEQLFSRLSKDDREKAHEWVFRFERLTGDDE